MTIRICAAATASDVVIGADDGGTRTHRQRCRQREISSSACVALLFCLCGSAVIEVVVTLGFTASSLTSLVSLSSFLLFSSLTTFSSNGALSHSAVCIAESSSLSSSSSIVAMGAMGSIFISSLSSSTSVAADVAVVLGSSKVFAGGGGGGGGVLNVPAGGGKGGGGEPCLAPIAFTAGGKGGGVAVAVVGVFVRGGKAVTVGAGVCCWAWAICLFGGGKGGGISELVLVEAFVSAFPQATLERVRECG
ncbi:hypothetical protein FF38_11416 [Lucilia cuprina]|uniref:Uncharacterized protein n=1 Tax=Lucilia cuprina TaxID=7375 RepID=A0A0L0CBU4_LUCCU|nr:hypothetical protein FF38_11416 [Lucilia cuprina]